MSYRSVFALCLLSLGTATGTAWAAEAPVTVGEFVVRLAALHGLEGDDVPGAVRELREIGVDLPPTLEPAEPLTRGELVRLSNGMGLRLSSVQPDSMVGTGLVDRYFRSFGDELLAENPGKGHGPGHGKGGPPFDPFSKARGKGSGKAKFNRTAVE